MKEFKEMNFLEKTGAYLVVSPFILLLGVAIILYDGFVFQQVWNLLAPRLFPLPSITLIQSIAINLLISYHKISSYKKVEKLDYWNIVISPLMLWLTAFVLTFFIK